jgi:pilus assembly protein CpaF
MSFELILANLNELAPYLADDDVSEIMLNGNGNHFYERCGRLFPLPVKITPGRLKMTIQFIAHELQMECDESEPIMNGRLPDGSRVAGILPPASPDGPTLTIRKFPARRRSLEDLVASGSLPFEVVEMVRSALQADENVLISGGTGSGKTTLLNGIASLLPQESRIVVIEDNKEIQVEAPHCVRLEARKKTDRCKAITIRELVKATLRHRPDHIILGEIRGAEAYDLLQAMNTGHGGSMTTIHANSPRLALSRLESCVLQARVRLPIAPIRRQIANAISLVVQVERTHGGRRHVAEVIRLIECDDRSRYSIETLYPGEGDHEITHLGASATG